MDTRTLGSRSVWTGLVLAGLFAGPTAGLSQTSKQCAGSEFRQFDFWIGDWRVTQGEKFAGTNHIERILDGCTLAENWQGTGGVTGKSFNTYDPARHVWHQTWVDNQGTLLVLEGGLREGSMVMEGDQAGTAGQSGTRERITWTPLEKSAVRQHWESSADHGKTWKTAFDGIYRHPE